METPPDADFGNLLAARNKDNVQNSRAFFGPQEMEEGMEFPDITTQQTAPGFRELRRWPRYKIRVPVTVILRREGKTSFVDGRGIDLNDGGIAVFAGVEMKEGEEVEISFTPPYRGVPLVARARIRNRRGYTYGMEFLSETPDDRQQVTKIHEVLTAMGAVFLDLSK